MNRTGAQRGQDLVRDVGGGEFLGIAQQDPGHVERDIPDSDHGDRARLPEIGLELHPEKTRIVYCKDGRRHQEHELVSFTFCGYMFRPRRAYNTKQGQVFTSFLPAVAPGKLTDMSRRASSWRLHRRTTLALDDLAEEVNLVLRGWLNYFTVFHPSAVIPIGRRMDRHLMRWARRKYKRLRRSEKRALQWLKGVRERAPGLFAHGDLRYQR